ncbi:MAG: hypothetical protein Q8Q00_04740 [Dehalococcoidia bacterium]|nr:hypothetical protein [Dehalococcoidia bacterium]
MSANQPHPPSLDVVYQEVKERLDIQLHQVDTLDAKAGTVLSVASLVMTIAAGLQATVGREDLHGWPLILLLAGALFYAFAMLFAFRGYWLRNFRRDPEPKPLRDLYLFQAPDFTKRRLTANRIQSFELNSQLIESKVWNIKAAIILLAVQTLTLVMALVLQRVGD